MTLIHSHQRCGYSDSPFARIHYFYTAGFRNGFQGMEAVCRHTKKKKTISKGHFFLMGKYFEDVRQDENTSRICWKREWGPLALWKKSYSQFRSHSQLTKSDTKSLKSRFDPKVKSPQIGLPMDPRHFSKGPTLFCDIRPTRGQLFGKKIKKYKTIVF